jgi:hypothetical protein
MNNLILQEEWGLSAIFNIKLGRPFNKIPLNNA